MWVVGFRVKIGIHNDMELCTDPFGEISDQGYLAAVGEP